MEFDIYNIPKEGVYLDIRPMSWDLAQRVEASNKATELGLGLYMAVGNSSTVYYATSVVAVGKVLVSMPKEYKGEIIAVCVMESASDDLDLSSALQGAL